MHTAQGVLELYKEFDPYQQNVLSRLQMLEENRDYKLFTIWENVNGEAMVVATAMGVLIRNLVGNGQDQALVENIIVHPKFRYQGIGKKLMQEVADWAKRHNCRKLIVVSNRKYGAKDFYESCGYENNSSQVFIKRL